MRGLIHVRQDIDDDSEVMQYAQYKISTYDHCAVEFYRQSYAERKNYT
jgi:hypothetical protein